MTETLTIIIFIVVAILFWKNRKIKNSHKLPQSLELIEFNNNANDPKFEGLHKGYKLTLSRELGSPGYNLFFTLETGGKDLTELKMIIISWSEWKERIFNFRYSAADDNVIIQGTQIRIDIGSFNNCAGSTNFLKRTASSKFLIVDLLDYELERNDFEYEKKYETQSIFCLFLSKKELSQFKNGHHYLDS